MAKPSKTLEWATEPESEVLEPSLGKRLLGWGLERPAYQYFNWLFNLIGQWCGFVDSQFAADGVKRVQAVASIAALKALVPNDGDTARVGASVYTFDAASTDTANDVLVVAPASGTGRWIHTAQAVAGVADGVASLGTNKELVVAATSGPAIKGESVSGVGGEFKANASRGAVNIAPQAADPATNTAGDLHYKSGVDSPLRVNDGTAWRGVATLQPLGHLVLSPAEGAVAALRIFGNGSPSVQMMPQYDDPAAVGAGGIHYKADEGLRVADGTEWRGVPTFDDATGRIPGVHIGKADADGVPSLNMDRKVVQDPASKGLANGIASLDGDGKVEQDQLRSVWARCNGVTVVSQAGGVLAGQNGGVGGYYRFPIDTSSEEDMCFVVTSNEGVNDYDFRAEYSPSTQMLFVLVRDGASRSLVDLTGLGLKFSIVGFR